MAGLTDAQKAALDRIKSIKTAPTEQKTPEQQAALDRIKGTQPTDKDYADPNKDFHYNVTPDSSWSDTVTSGALNAPRSAYDLGAGLVSTALHPQETGLAVNKLAKGAWEAAGPNGPAEAKLREWLKSAGMEGILPAASATPAPPLSPNGQMASQMGHDALNVIKHPIVSLANDPVGLPANFAGAGVLGTGKTLSHLSEISKLAPLEDVVRGLKDTSDVAHARIPGRPDIKVKGSDVVDNMLSAARTAGYDANAPEYAGTHGGMKYIENMGKSGDLSLTDLQNLRKTAANPDLQYSKSPNSDNRVAEAMRKAFDSSLNSAHPEADTILSDAREASSMHQNAAGFQNMIETGRVKGAASGNNVKDANKEIVKYLLDPTKMKSIPDDIAARMESSLAPATTAGPGLMQMLRNEGLGALTGAATHYLTGLNPYISVGVGAGLPAAVKGYDVVKRASEVKKLNSGLDTMVRTLADSPTKEGRTYSTKAGPKSKAAGIMTLLSNQDRR